MPKKNRKLIRFSGVFLLFIFLTGIMLALFCQRHYVTPIIMYHYVHPHPDAGDRLTITPQAFECQMRYLKSNHYNVIPLEALADLIRDKQRVPSRTVAITIDDGHSDNFNYIFPALKKYNLAATMFIIIDEVARPQGDRLTWEQIKIMRDSGLVTFGSHTLGPEPLINIASDEELRKQVFESKKILEAKLNCKVGLFSYPEGFFNDKIKQLVVKAGYKAAVAVMPKGRYPNDDLFALKRLRISQGSDNLFVFWFETSGIYTFIRENDKDKR